MSPDLKPIRAVTVIGANPGTPPANPALLPLASLAEGLQPLVQGGPWPELARYELPGAPWPDVAEPSPPWNGPSLSIGTEPGRAAAALQPPTGPALDELLARLRADGLALAEPASLFPGPVDPAGDPVPSPGDGPIPTSASRLDSGWSASEIPGAAWETFRGRDQQPAARLSGSPPGPEAGSEVLSSEMIGELVSRLLGAVERLEQAAERITQPTPSSLASLPRPFRGRVDG